MPKLKIPTEWDLSASRRYKRQNMERAMRGRIERGLVELITNSDDSYRGLEEDQSSRSNAKDRHPGGALTGLHRAGAPSGSATWYSLKARFGSR